MAEKEGKIVQELRRCLAKDRTLLARHEELLAALQLQLPLSEMKDYRLLEKSLRDTSLGETMLTADSGDAAAKAQAKERATQALLACGTQARAAERIVSLLAAALGWDTLRQAPAPVAKPVPSVEAALPKAPVGTETAWDCPCGQKGNHDAFCSSCGRPRPQGREDEGAVGMPHQAPAAAPVQTPRQTVGARVAQPRVPRSPVQQPPVRGTVASGGQTVKIAMIVAIVVLAGVLIFFGMREFGGKENPGVQSASTSSSASAKPTRPEKPEKKEAAQPAVSQRPMKTDLSLGGIDLGDATSIIKEVEKGKTENDRKQDGRLVRHYFDDMQIVTEGSEITALVSNNDKVSTKRGIHQGSSFAEVKRAYGTDYYKTGLGGNLTAFEYEAQTADGRPGLVRFAINDDTHKVDYISVRLTR